MGRIVVEATIENGADPAFRIRSNALIDTGAAYLTLPLAWRDRLGELMLLDTVSLETATQAVVSGDICGPVLLRMDQFRPVLTEALFIEMEPSDGHDGHYEPLIGYIPLEQAQAAVDLVGHRLVKFSRVDLKPLIPSRTGFTAPEQAAGPDRWQPHGRTREPGPGTRTRRTGTR